MAGDPFYRTPQWRCLRAATLERDGHRCVVPGCATPTYRLTVDHIVSRRKGGADALHNLRTLCDHHDRMVKELPGGSRRRNGILPTGCDFDGRPRDQAHPWARKASATG